MSNANVVGVAILTIVYLVIKFLNRTDTPKIKGLPEIPGWPLFGSLFELGTSHAQVAQRWAAKYGPVFQVRMGNRRIVFANTFDSVKHLWISNQSALISRPTLHTFHKLVSSSEGFTIGTSPWDESCKRRRKAAATALNRPAVVSYMPILDLESMVSIREMYRHAKDGKAELDIIPYWQRFALNTSLSLNYGYRIQGNVDDDLLKEIVHVEREVSNFRSTSNNWQDYVPLLRLLPSSAKLANEYRHRRAKYMHDLLNMLKERIADGTDKPCITGNCLKDPETRLNDAEIMSIGLSMVSAGIDTVPGNLIMGIAYLSSEDGQAIQKRAYDDIMRIYPDGDAWEKCLRESKVHYITALVKEVLRFWTVIPICLPRTSIKDVVYRSAVIPAGTTFYMNAYAANYDASHFEDPHLFNPYRYLKSDGENRELKEADGTPHYAYGAGSRMCAGSFLANRELYIAFLRLILAFEMLPAEHEADRPTLDLFEANAAPTGLTLDPKTFKIGLRVRDPQLLERWMDDSDYRTKDL